MRSLAVRERNIGQVNPEKRFATGSAKNPGILDQFYIV